MSRLVLIILGWFIIMGALAILWIASVPGQLTLTRLGINLPELQPKDVGLYFNLVFGAGFVFLAGCTLETFILGISGGLTGGSSESSAEDVVGGTREAWGVKGKILLGIVAYLGITALFGLYLTFFALPGEKSVGQVLGRFTDLQFLEFILTWPYQLFAVARLFDLEPEAFH